MGFADLHSKEEGATLSRRSSRVPNHRSRRPRLRAKSSDGRFRIDQESYTSGQAARLLRIPARTMRRYLSIGKLVGDQNPITQTWRISREALVEFIKSQGGEVLVIQHRLQVLVIDQQSDIAEMLEQIKESDRPDIEVSTFEEVGDALIESGALCPDIIVLSATSPFYDGVGLLKLLRANPRLKRSKILAIVNEYHNLEPTESIRGVKTLKRPFSQDQLLAMLNGMLTTHHDA